MTLQKTRHIYSAVAKAIDAWGDRCHINARSHLGKVLGFRGDNAGIQLSNTLNSTTYNPTSPKRLSVDHLDVLLCEVDDIAQAKILSAIVEPHGFTLNRVGTVKAKALDLTEILSSILDINTHQGSISEVIGAALQDSHLDDKEKADIKDHIGELRRLLRAFEANLQEGVK